MNYISLRLETEFSQQFTDSGQDNVGFINLCYILNLSQLKSVYHSGQSFASAIVVLIYILFGLSDHCRKLHFLIVNVN